MASADLATPYLSFVCVGRNDNYGVNFLARTQRFLDSLGKGADTARNLCLELVWVEWNPVEGVRHVLEELTPPKRTNLSIVKVVVPKHVHDSFENSKIMPVFEYIGKNVGIRRASGAFILACNPDLMFTSQFFRWLATKPLVAERTFYRATRIDYSKHDSSLSFVNHPLQTFAMWNLNSMVINYKSETPLKLNLTPIERIVSPDNIDAIAEEIGPYLPRVEDVKKPFTLTGGDFILLSREEWNRSNGFHELTPTFSHMDTILITELYNSGFAQVILPYNMSIFHWDHDREIATRAPIVTKDPGPKQTEPFGHLLDRKGADITSATL
jgi:hypothetical protein